MCPISAIVPRAFTRTVALNERQRNFVWCLSVTLQVQFGHAGACARGQGETAADKNAALAAAGAVVPVSFDEFPSKIKEVFDG